MSEDFPQIGAYSSLTCTLCQKMILYTEGDPIDDLSLPLSVCDDCKFLFLEDLDTPSREPRRTMRPPSRRRSRFSSSESIENLFSQQFSQMINLVRQQNQPPEQAVPEEGEPVSNRSFRRTSARTTPTGSGRWPRVWSDTESDADSVYAENESMAVSFTTYGGESDASVDLTGFLDQNEDGSDFDSDTDIDPMQAGLNHWISEDGDGWEEEEEEEEEEEDDDERLLVQNFLSLGDSELRPRSPEPIWRLGDPMDYLDSRGVEEFLLRLAAEEDNGGGFGFGSRRGAPPASAAFVENLPKISVEKPNEVCAICKDMLTVGSEASQLPCSHLYHHPCILPWLSTRNSCPLCRYELPTDDVDYEEGKRNVVVVPRDVSDDISVVSSDREDNAVEYSEEEREIVEENDNGGRGGRWLFLAAAPIVGLVGIVLVLWLGNLRAEGRGGSVSVASESRVRVDIAGGGGSSGRREIRSRRWWSFF